MKEFSKGDLIIGFLDKLYKEKSKILQRDMYYYNNNYYADEDYVKELKEDIDISTGMVENMQTIYNYIESVEKINTIKWGDEFTKVIGFISYKERLDEEHELIVNITEGFLVDYYILIKDTIISPKDTNNSNIDNELIKKTEKALRRFVLEGYIRKVNE